MIFDTLPVETLDLIDSYLDMASSVAWARTCSSLYAFRATSSVRLETLRLLAECSNSREKALAVVIEEDNIPVGIELLNAIKIDGGLIDFVRGYCDRGVVRSGHNYSLLESLAPYFPPGCNVWIYFLSYLQAWMPELTGELVQLLINAVNTLVHSVTVAIRLGKYGNVVYQVNDGVAEITVGERPLRPESLVNLVHLKWHLDEKSSIIHMATLLGSAFIREIRCLAIDMDNPAYLVLLDSRSCPVPSLSPFRFDLALPDDEIDRIVDYGCPRLRSIPLVQTQLRTHEPYEVKVAVDYWNNTVEETNNHRNAKCRRCHPMPSRAEVVEYYKAIC